MDDPSDLRTSLSLLARVGSDLQDHAAWEEFVRRYRPRILQWCRQWQLQEADAHDVAQNVLLRLARQLANFRYDPSRSFRAWLKVVTRAAWCDWLDAQPPHPGTGDANVLAVLCTAEARDDLVKRIEDEYDSELLQAASARVQKRVEPHTWEAFRLLAFEGLSGAEAAERLGMKVGAVFVARSKVQKMLQQTIQELEAEAEP